MHFMYKNKRAMYIFKNINIYEFGTYPNDTINEVAKKQQGL